MKNFLTLILCLSMFAFTACEEETLSTTVDENIEEIDTDTAFTETIEFASLDGLTITADHYHISNTAPVIVLCHQAGYSRGEYLEIAPKLNELGYNCLAIDQRSGREIKGVSNETARRASEEGLPNEFIDAKQDIEAAIAKAKELYSTELLIWGSSYSSSLVLLVAAENQDVDRVLSFSPGEYLRTVRVRQSVTTLHKPAFLTSSKTENRQTEDIFNAIPSTNKTQFVPEGAGEHGSKALWEEKPDHHEYWEAVTAFLGE